MHASPSPTGSYSTTAVSASNVPVNRAGLETLGPDLITRELGRLGRVAHELQRQHVVSMARLNDQAEWLLEGNAELVD